VICKSDWQGRVVLRSAGRATADFAFAQQHAKSAMFGLCKFNDLVKGYIRDSMAYTAHVLYMLRQEQAQSLIAQLVQLWHVFGFAFNTVKALV